MVASWPNILAVLAVISAVLGVVALACAAVCAAQGMSPTTWDYPDTDVLSGGDVSAMISEWRRVVVANRDRNDARFHRHYRGFQRLLFAMILIGFQGAACAAYTMSVMSAAPPAQSSLPRCPTK